MSRNSNRFRQAVLLAFAVAGLFSLTACGGGNGSGGIGIVLANVPSSLTVNQTASLSADVVNDTGTGGVNWTCAPSGSCGSFNPTNTASGGTTIYTAPATAGTVTVTATAADKSSATQSATITISTGSANMNLNGQYAYLVTGTDGNGFYTAAGSISADGNGNITTGEQDFEDPSTDSEGLSLTGTYTITGSNGQGSMTLNVGGNTETFSFVLGSSNKHGLIIEFDANATSSGTLDLQTPTPFAAINGEFSFTASGQDLTLLNDGVFSPAAVGGVAALSSAGGTVSSGLADVNDAGELSSAQPFTGTMTAPDSNGRGQLTFSTLALNFAYYEVQGEVLRIIEEDNNFLSAGTAYGQGATPAFTNSSLSGNYVFYDSASTPTFGVNVLGQFNANGGGDFTTAYADTNDSGNFTHTSIASGSSYSILSGSSGRGTFTLPGTGGTTQDAGNLMIYMVDPAINLLDPSSSTGTGGALLLDIDANAVGIGLVVPQSSGTFSGAYGANLQYFNSNGEVDLVGPLTATSGSLSGTVDVNDDGTTQPAVTASGSFSADSNNAGRYTGSLTYGGNTINGTYYQASNGSVLFNDTDSNDIGIGFLQQ
jgi:hypothetical protein